MFVLTAILAVLLLVLFTSPALHAADDQIHFTGNNLSYQGNQYVDAGKAQAGNSANIPDGSEYFTFNEPLSSPTATPKTDIIYFAAGKTPSDEAKATFVTYNTNPSSSPPTYSNPTNQKDITVDTTLDATDGGSSCAINGIGWIVCPISNALAGGMDWFMGVLGNFVKVQPLNVTDSHNDLYVAWNIMRSIANVAFIIVFLIIIYSQLTNFGVSNYGLKKLLPRLIVGVVIVNLSYFICAAILDASNILGSSIQDLLISMRTTVFNATGSNASVANGDFTNLTTSILAGGTVAAGLTVGGIAVNSTLIGASLAGLWYLIVPALVALLLAIMVVVLILATRQALIIILIVISPLAFVAYLLPNTEKWFKSWQKTFTTMMVFYPAFSVVLGGSQLASAVIVKNASSMTVVVLGLIVQVAPLAITPWLLRLSGSTIQSVAKFAQGFNKRINGAVNGWAKPRREAARLTSLGKQGTKNPFRNNAQYWYSRGQRVKEKTEIGTQSAANMYNAYTGRRGNQNPAKWHAGLETQRRTAHEQKEILATRDEKSWANHVLTNNHAREADMELRTLKDQVTGAKATLDSNYELRKAANFKNTAEYNKMSTAMQTFVNEAQDATEIIATQGMRSNIAKRNQTQDFAKRLKGSVELRNLAGAVEIDAQGAESALASAINSVNEAYGKSVTEARTIFNSFNISSLEKQAFAMGEKNVEVVDDDLNTYTFDVNNIFTREAAIEDQVAAGGLNDVESMVRESGGALKAYRKTIAGGILKNAALREKALYLSGQTIDDIKLGNITSDDDLMVAVTRTIANGKINEKQIASQDPASAKRFANAAAAPKFQGTSKDMKFEIKEDDMAERVGQLSEAVRNAFKGDERSSILGASRKPLEKIGQMGDPSFKADDYNAPDQPTTPDEPTP